LQQSRQPCTGRGCSSRRRCAIDSQRTILHAAQNPSNPEQLLWHPISITTPPPTLTETLERAEVPWKNSGQLCGAARRSAQRGAAAYPTVCRKRGHISVGLLHGKSLSPCVLTPPIRLQHWEPGRAAAETTPWQFHPSMAGQRSSSAPSRKPAAAVNPPAVAAGEQTEKVPHSSAWG